MKQFLNLLLWILLNTNVYIFCSQNTNSALDLKKSFFNNTNLYTIRHKHVVSIMTHEEHEQNNRNIVYAVMTRNIQDLTSLLNQGANPDTKNYYYGSDYFRGDTLLHLAVKIGAFEIVKLLLENDANQELLDNGTSRKPLTWCIEKAKHEECPEKKKEYQQILNLLKEKK